MAYFLYTKYLLIFLVTDMITRAAKNISPQQHSQQLIELIREEIIQEGPMSFARFMELSLYAPGFGYYVSGLQKFGRQGDFVTAPEISPLFSRCVAAQCQQVLAQMPGANILEFGAGSGRMAVDILLALKEANCLPEHYYILELSAELKERQRQLCAEVIPDLLPNIVWLDALPRMPFKGVVLANEVLDAMPVHRFKITAEEKLYELSVDWQNEKLTWVMHEPSEEINAAVAGLNLSVRDYESEINLLLPHWFASLSDFLTEGVVLLFDYGFPRSEFYLPERDQGSLMCHYQHRAHSDPFCNVGLQDITTHVDFTAVAEAASNAGFDIYGYTNQASFLLSCGISDLILPYLGTKQELDICNQVKILTLPQEMGELFKCIALGKNFGHPLLGFSYRDLRHYL